MPEGFEWRDSIQRWFYQVRHLSKGALKATVEIEERRVLVHLQIKGEEDTSSLCTYRGSADGALAYLQGVANTLFLMGRSISNKMRNREGREDG
jgi:hypothetical protein